MDSISLKIVLILTIGFGFASILGYISYRIKLSPLLGYLAAGYLIGPYSPGFVADYVVAEQLAEVGVVLMMLHVGLHFKWQDLMKFKGIAIPGAIIQTAVTTVVTALFVYSVGWSLESGIILGLAIGVASTVVVVRVLSDNNLLNTPEGHISVGWLLVEDLMTMGALFLIPLLVVDQGSVQKLFPIESILVNVGLILMKSALFVVILFAFGQKLISYILEKVSALQCPELFTLTILTVTLLIATGSTLFLGTSLALGAFLAGMCIGQTTIKHQAVANAMPLKDAFVVIFFLSIGMLFNPQMIVEHFPLFISILAVILIVKPLTAFIVTLAFRRPLKAAVTVALALAQIGEFSFILAEQAMELDIFPEKGYDIIVACAIVSISINPTLFKLATKLEKSIDIS